MTRYTGGKARLGHHIASIIRNVVDEYKLDIKGYVEPFSGMLGCYRHIPALFEDYEKEQKIKLDYLAGDINGSIIEMWKATKNGWIPPTEFYTKKQWINLRETDGFSALKGFVGLAYSFRGIYFSGYTDNKNIKYSSQNVVNVGKLVNRVNFRQDSYESFSDLKGFIFYLDPPYKNVQNTYIEKFDYGKFQLWVEKMRKHNTIFISEYSQPVENCKLLWNKGRENLYLCQ